MISGDIIDKAKDGKIEATKPSLSIDPSVSANHHWKFGASAGATLCVE